jgi:flagellar motor switch protein FliN/FliY
MSAETNNPAMNWDDPAEAVAAAASDRSSAVQPVSFGQLGPGIRGDGSRNLDLLLDVDIPISVEVGRAQMSLEEVLSLVPGSVVALDKKAEEPVDLRVNGKLVARGEVVLVDDTYGLRITQIVDAAGRIETLR